MRACGSLTEGSGKRVGEMFLMAILHVWPLGGRMEQGRGAAALNVLFVFKTGLLSVW